MSKHFVPILGYGVGVCVREGGGGKGGGAQLEYNLKE